MIRYMHGICTEVGCDFTARQSSIEHVNFQPCWENVRASIERKRYFNMQDWGLCMAALNAKTRFYHS